MKRTAAYFLAQLKRAARLLPGQILADLTVCVCAGAFVCLLIAQGDSLGGRDKISDSQEPAQSLHRSCQ